MEDGAESNSRTILTPFVRDVLKPPPSKQTQNYTQYDLFCLSSKLTILFRRHKRLGSCYPYFFLARTGDTMTVTVEARRAGTRITVDDELATDLTGMVKWALAYHPQSAIVFDMRTPVQRGDVTLPISWLMCMSRLITLPGRFQRVVDDRNGVILINLNHVTNFDGAYDTVNRSIVDALFQMAEAGYTACTSDFALKWHLTSAMAGSSLIYRADWIDERLPQLASLFLLERIWEAPVTVRVQDDLVTKHLLSVSLNGIGIVPMFIGNKMYVSGVNSLTAYQQLMSTIHATQLTGGKVATLQLPNKKIIVRLKKAAVFLLPQTTVSVYITNYKQKPYTFSCLIPQSYSSSDTSASLRLAAYTKLQ